MNGKEFNEILDIRLKKTKEILSSKSKEYSTDSNKLHNFDRGASMTGKIREEVILGFALKHHISILDMVDNINNNILPTEVLVDEKIGDLINYLILLEASIKERIGDK